MSGVDKSPGACMRCCIGIGCGMLASSSILALLLTLLPCPVGAGGASPGVLVSCRSGLPGGGTFPAGGASGGGGEPQLPPPARCSRGHPVSALCRDMSMLLGLQPG
jgi:hypothetical protein